MTRVFDNPSEFTHDMLHGFTQAYPHIVRKVQGGVVRAGQHNAGQVAVVVGGGAGHYPWTCGLVGTGLAHGAVVGNVFTSPSAQDVIAVVEELTPNAGVLLCIGNYAGDDMNFRLAAEHLTGRGIDCRIVKVTDDVASAPLVERDKRRGIAGSFAVFKIAGRSADLGNAIDLVEAHATTANSRLRTFGVAFAGCTLPGSEGPLFDLPPGTMAVGLGIHGEPGIREQRQGTASDIARLLVDGLIGDGAGNEPNRQVAVILNGLGSTKYEELFVLWGRVSRLLEQRGLMLLAPEIGELVTSLDMAGCSLSILDLDETLAQLWTAPARSTAFARGVTADHPAPLVTTAPPFRDVNGIPSGPTTVYTGAATAPSPACTLTVAAALRNARLALQCEETRLGALDAFAGDGDHGHGMVRGISAAAASLDRSVQEGGMPPGDALRRAGHEWAAVAGGTSGVLWGAAIEAFGVALGESVSPKPGAIRDALTAAMSRIEELGGAREGDKTMLDALGPFVREFEKGLAEGPADLAQIWEGAAAASVNAAEATSVLEPKVGRARPLSGRSVGHADPGAVSMALVLRSIGEVLWGVT